MARQPGMAEEARREPIRNAVSGTLFEVPAGGHAEAEWEFVNDSPDVANFYLLADGLPAKDWVVGDGESSSAWAAAAGTGSLRLILSPRRDAAAGDYPFQVTMISGGSAVGSGPIALILRVTPAAELPVFEDPIKIEPEVAAPVGAEQITASDTAAAPPEEPIAPAFSPPPPVPIAPSAPPETPKPPVAAIPPVPRPAAPSPPAAKPPVAEVTVVSAPEHIPEVRNAPAPMPPEDPLPVIDYEPDQAEEHYQQPDTEDAGPQQPSLLNPEDGTLIPLCPGDTMLVSFEFVNDGGQERTYILDEDRSLESGWITLVQDQVNLTRNAHGTVSVRLSPPMNAEPGDYPFTVTIGLQGGTLKPVSLILSVLATPAVRLSAKEAAVSIGPFGRDIDFALTVQSAGNADTAFRIAVKSPDAKNDTNGQAVPEQIYETPSWRYLFDRELETLRSASSGRAPQPITIRLRLRRRGIWWLGFRESHLARVSAVPVTDSSNGGKPGNTIDVKATRWRLLPFPALMLIPITLGIMMFLSGGAGSLDVPTSAYRDDHGQYWVVQNAAQPTDQYGQQKALKLVWKAPPLALLRLTGTNLNKTEVGGGAFSENIPVSNDARNSQRTYTVSRLVGGGDAAATVNFVYTNPETPLLVTDAVAHKELTGPIINLSVPSNGYARLDLKNISRQPHRINWYRVNDLDPESQFKELNDKDTGSIEQGDFEHLVFRRSPSNSASATDHMVFVTTDASRPLLTINLTEGP